MCQFTNYALITRESTEKKDTAFQPPVTLHERPSSFFVAPMCIPDIASHWHCQIWQALLGLLPPHLHTESDKAIKYWRWQRPENEAKVNIHMNSIFILTKLMLITKISTPLEDSSTLYMPLFKHNHTPRCSKKRLVLQVYLGLNALDFSHILVCM